MEINDLKFLIFLVKQGDSLSLPSVQNPDQFLAQSSEACLGTYGVCLPPSDFSKQFSVDNVQRPQVAPVGLARNKYLSKPYSFATNSGIPLCMFVLCCCVAICFLDCW